MSLATQVTALATRIATECKSIRTALAGKADTTHNHTSAQVTSGVLDQARIPLVSSTPYTLTFGSNITPDASLGNNIKITATSTPFNLNPPTNPTDGQMLMIAILAQSGAKTVNIAGGIVLTTGTVASYAIASTKVGFLGLRYSALAGNWTLLAQTQEL